MRYHDRDERADAAGSPKARATHLQTTGMASQNGVARVGAKRSTRLVPARYVPACALLIGLAGCARRAPGPEECHDLALTWVLGLRARAAVQDPGRAAERAIVDRTTECLTTPYDHELVRCVTAGAPPRRCLGAFEARRRALRVNAAPRYHKMSSMFF